MTTTTVEVVAAVQLGGRERSAWRAFQAADPQLAGPFHSLGFVDAAAAHAPRAGVAVVRRRGTPVAFLPLQRRGSKLHPLGAPLADYHALIAAPDSDVSVGALLRRLGAERFTATGWVGAAPAAGLTERNRMVADLSAGFDAWRLARASVVKDKLRRGRALARDHGEPAVTLDDADPAALDWLLTQKRRQYVLTHQHDVFACGWTERLLRSLARHDAADVRGGISTLRVDGRIVAAEYVLGAADVRHLWFPAYDRDFARYSPGTLLLIEQLKRWAEQGVRTADFGPDVEGYKAELADAAGVVHEGWLLAEGRAPLAVPGELARLRRKAERRLAVIRACEADRVNAAAALLDNVVAICRRRVQQAGVGIGAAGVVAARYAEPLPAFTL